MELDIDKYIDEGYRYLIYAILERSLQDFKGYAIQYKKSVNPTYGQLALKKMQKEIDYVKRPSSAFSLWAALVFEDVELVREHVLKQMKAICDSKYLIF